MGGNGSYSDVLKKVPVALRTHNEAISRIDGHKILIQKVAEKQIKIPMNSNSENPTYLCSKVTKDGDIQIESIAVYEKHKVTKVIDLKFDDNGNYLPYSSSEKSSHYHYWEENENGFVGRKRHDKNNRHPIPSEYESLIEKVVNYNKEKHKWDKEKLQ